MPPVSEKMCAQLSPTGEVNQPSRMRERADQAGRALGVAVERLDHLITRHAFLQRLRVEIGRDQGEGVMMRRAGRRARAGVGRLLRGADAADKLVAGLGELALRKGGDGSRATPAAADCAAAR